jgi:hypothetical protein
VVRSAAETVRSRKRVRTRGMREGAPLELEGVGPLEVLDVPAAPASEVPRGDGGGGAEGEEL